MSDNNYVITKFPWPPHKVAEENYLSEINDRIDKLRSLLNEAKTTEKRGKRRVNSIADFYEE